MMLPCLYYSFTSAVAYHSFYVQNYWNVNMQIIFCAKQLERFKIKRKKESSYTQIEIYISTNYPHIFLEVDTQVHGNLFHSHYHLIINVIDENSNLLHLMTGIVCTIYE